MEVLSMKRLCYLSVIWNASKGALMIHLLMVSIY